MELNFCRRCGKPVKKIKGHIYECTTGHLLFANCSPAVGVIFLAKDGQVILSRRGIEPHKGMLDTFGGFVDGEETFEAAAERELLEETGLQSSDYEKLRFLCSGIGHYPFKEEVLPVLSAIFWTRLKNNAYPQAKDDVAEVVKLPLNKINMSQVHDDDVKSALITFIPRLKGIIEPNKEDK